MLRDDGESGVSSVVGTVLMLAVTVTAFTGFSVVALDYVADRPTAPRSDLALVTGSGSLYLVHRGGESFASSGGELVVNHDEVEERIALTDPRLAGIGDDWDLGDQLCIKGDAPGCLYAADEPIGGAFLVAEGVLLLETGTRARNIRSDLTAELVSQSPASPGVGSSITWTVRVGNGGEGPMSRASVLVNVEVDGVLVATATVPGPLAAGSSATATSTPWSGSGPGTKALSLIVDPTALVTEEDESNNVAASTFELLPGQADPGQPFIDLNGDGLYTPGEDGEMTEAQVTELQGGSFDAGSGSLVIPPSIGDISGTEVSFEAGGDIVVNVDLSANGPVTLTAGGDVVINVVELTASDGALTIDAGGDIVFDEASLEALKPNRDLVLRADGNIIAPGLVVSVNGPITIEAGGTLDLTGASLVVTSSNSLLALSGDAVDVDGASINNNCATCNNGNTLTVTANAGAISAVGVTSQSKGDQTWKATGGGIDLSSSTLVASNTGRALVACLGSDTPDGLVLSGSLAFTDANSKLNAQRGATCNQDANSDAYVTPWPAAATDSPRSKLE